MPTLAEALKVEIKGDAGHFNRAIATMHSKTVSVVSGISNKFLGLTKTLVKLGSVASAALGGFSLYKTLESAAATEKAFANLAGLFTESTKHLQGYKKAIDNLSISMGINSVEVTNAYYQAVSAGFRSLAEAKQVVEAASKAAIGGGAEMPVAVEAITRTLNAYSLSGEHATRISDLLFQTVNYGVTTFGQLAPNIGTVAAIAAKAQVPLEDLFATIATISKGMPTEETITSVTQIISGFISPTEQAANAAKQMGIDLSATGLAAMGLVGALTKMSKLTAEQQAELFPNIRALRGVMLATADAAIELNANYGQMWNSAGATANALNKQVDTFSYQIGRLWNSVTEIARMAADIFLPELKSIAEWLNYEGSRLMLGWVKELKDGMESWREQFAEETMGMTTKEKISKAINNLFTYIGSKLVPKFVKLGIKIGKGLAKAIIEGLLSAGGKVIKWILDQITAEGGIDIPWPVFSPNFIPSWKIFQHGGPVQGTFNQPTPVLAHGGEYVVNPYAARANMPLLEAINRGGSMYHDASIMNFHFGDRFSRQLVRDKLIPELQRAKKQGYGLEGRNW